MEFKDLLAARRSVRRFSDRPVPRETVDRLLVQTLSAPSSRNSRSTRLLVVDDPALVARMAEMRDYGSAIMAGAPLAVVVLGDRTATDLWQVNAAISATVLHLAAVDEGLASCWVHIAGRPRRREEPAGEQAADYLRGFLPIPETCEPLCAIVMGYSDFRPAPLPEADDAQRIIRLNE
ncbi:nitroreductase family protein [Alistipes sp.]|uniref:nitroreductase family protein n=1 Tax=Alistipes sp. TaxID=1872444 RepID=UPI003AF19E65